LRGVERGTDLVMSEDVRGNESLLGPANPTEITVITPYVSEYWLLYLTHLIYLCNSKVNILKI
jgi:hypothetical protein